MVSWAPVFGHVNHMRRSYGLAALPDPTGDLPWAEVQGDANSFRHFRWTFRVLHKLSTHFSFLISRGPHASRRLRSFCSLPHLHFLLFFLFLFFQFSLACFGWA